jgi:protease I
MVTQHLLGLRVAILAADGFEQVELTRPRKELLRQGAAVEIISLRSGAIRGMHHLVPGKKVKVDRTVFTADPAQYDALLLPGGLANPDTLRQSDAALDFVRAFDRAGKPIAAICHGPWVLISAGLVRGRRLTSWPAIQDDVRNAGGIWEDKALVHDDNWISSRDPHDLPVFNDAIVEHFSRHLVVHERRRAVPSAGLIAVGGGALIALGLAVRWLAGKRPGELPAGAKHPGSASLAAYEQMTGMDVTSSPLAASTASTAGRDTGATRGQPAPASSP